MRRVITGLLIQLVVICVSASLAFSAPCDGASGAAHANGGGFVANTEIVSATAYVGPDVEVCDTARTDHARVHGYARLLFGADVGGKDNVSGILLSGGFGDDDDGDFSIPFPPLPSW